MLEQFAREFQQLYPRAKLLAASSADLVKEKRRAFVARVTTGDWDPVILTRTAFERIAMSPPPRPANSTPSSASCGRPLERQRSEGPPAAPRSRRRCSQHVHAQAGRTPSSSSKPGCSTPRRRSRNGWPRTTTRPSPSNRPASTTSSSTRPTTSRTSTPPAGSALRRSRAPTGPRTWR
ncbi:hypothetical protein ACFQV8_00115 [Pseudonocardia benzenivorans]